MVKEEVVSFPVIRAGVERTTPVIRAEHDGHAGNIVHILRITTDISPPDHAYDSRRTPYSGTATLIDDLTAHIVRENDVLFSRFERW
ncbi:MAG: hemerythrin domain-containing protein [Nitratireductor sp.]|nr:hemerythrin domain-containing protein [Nitratireductor sp.]